MIPTLSTARLTLRPYARSDFDTYAAFFASDRARYMGGPIDAEKAWSWFTNDAATWALYDFGTLAIEHQGQLAGFAGLVQPPSFPEPECGWVVYDGFTGQGFAKEAAAAMLDFTFSATDLDSVVSYVDPDNRASHAVARALGGTIDPDARGPWPDEGTIIYRHVRKEPA